jgi:hypothetical protein
MLNKQCTQSMKSCCSSETFSLANYNIVSTTYFLPNDNISVDFRFIFGLFDSGNKILQMFQISFLTLKCYRKALSSCDIESTRLISGMIGTSILGHFSFRPLYPSTVYTYLFLCLRLR